LNVEQVNLADGVSNSYGIDFPQAFMSQGGNLIGNTGYGYGDADAVGYSERLSLLFTEEVGREVLDSDDDYIGQPIGTALTRAKQSYLRNLSYMDEHDIKSLMVMTLYGLPFIRVKVDNPQPFPPEEATPGSRPLIIDVPDSGLVERTITFTVDVALDGFTNRTQRRYPTLNDGDVTVLADTFIQAGFGTASEPRIIQAAQGGMPEFPEFAYDLSVSGSGGENLHIQSVTFLDGSYGTVEDYAPVVSQVISQEIDYLPEVDFAPPFDTGDGLWYPELFYDYTTTDILTGTEQRNQLLVMPVQFQAQDEGESGLLRLYDQMTFRVLYVDPTAAQADRTLSDTVPPVIEAVRTVQPGQQNQLAATNARVLVEARDDVSADEALLVEGAYIVENDTGDTWVNTTFTYDAENERWEGAIPGDAGTVSYIVYVYDEAGNMSTFTGKGGFSGQDVTALENATIQGPGAVIIDETTTFTVEVAPATATMPISYTWAPEPDMGQGTAVVSYTFATTGTRTLAVEVRNIAGPVTGTLEVDVMRDDILVYLPLIVR
jgi:hypothetical protein